MRVPTSARVASLTCGYADRPRLAFGLPKRREFPGVSGVFIVEPSKDCTRKPRTTRPPVCGSHSATERLKRISNGSMPTRSRAFVTARVHGGPSSGQCSRVHHVSFSFSSRFTYDVRRQSPIRITNHTVSGAGSSRSRIDSRPARSSASPTHSGFSSFASDSTVKPAPCRSRIDTAPPMKPMADPSIVPDCPGRQSLYRHLAGICLHIC